MYEDDPTRDPLDDVEDLLTIRAHSPRFWDADAAEFTVADPYEHPSWDVYEALTEDGWDDPADAVEVREHLAEEHRLLPLADTPTARPVVHGIDQALDTPVLSPEEELHDLVLALMPAMPVYADHVEQGAAA